LAFTITINGKTDRQQAGGLDVALPRAAGRSASGTQAEERSSATKSGHPKFARNGSGEARMQTPQQGAIRERAPGLREMQSPARSFFAMETARRSCRALAAAFSLQLVRNNAVEFIHPLRSPQSQAGQHHRSALALDQSFDRPDPAAASVQADHVGQDGSLVNA